MNSAVDRGITRFRATIKATASLRRLARGSQGVVLHAFGPLLRHFGTDAGRLVALLDAACEVALDRGSRRALLAANRAADQLEAMARRLPADEQASVLVELERRRQTLLFRDQGFGEEYARAADEARQSRKLPGKAQQARVGKKEAALQKKADATCAEFGKRMNASGKTKDPVIAIYARFRRAVPLLSAGMNDAARKAAGQAEAFRDLLKRYAKTPTPDLQSQLWGVVSAVRGSLGESYALGSKTWRAEADRLLVEASRDALRINREAAALAGRAAGGPRPAFQAIELSQLEHQVKLNGLEGPDAMIALIDPRRRRMVLRARAQVKTAKVSEGVEQTLNDDLRLLGQESKKPAETPIVEFRRNGKTETYVVEVIPSVREDRYALDMMGARIPEKDLKELAAAGRRIETMQLDMSVDDFTQLTLSLLESAVRALP
jgi:hypothetical protein